MIPVEAGGSYASKNILIMFYSEFWKHYIEHKFLDIDFSYHDHYDAYSNSTHDRRIFINLINHFLETPG